MVGEGIIKVAYNYKKEIIDNLIEKGYIKEDKIDELNKTLEEIKIQCNKILKDAGETLIGEESETLKRMKNGWKK